MTKIYFGKLEIGTINDQSAVHYGRNVIVGVHSHRKENEAFGELSGQNNMLGRGRFAVRDPDTMDIWLTRSKAARERLSRLTSTDS